MRTPRIFTDSPLTAGGVSALDDNAARHVGKVLRMQAGQQLVLFNGDGMEYPATITSAGKNAVEVDIDTPVENRAESPLSVVLGQTLSRGDRMDYAIQKSVETGVSVIVPLVTERCEVRLKGDREEKRVKHWQSVAISAAEQCGRAVIPTVTGVMNLDDWFRYTADCDARLVLHHRTNRPLDAMDRPSRLALMIGPEGGLSGEEIRLAEEKGFSATALGPRVMRTETAPVAAIALCQWLWGDLRQG